MTTLISCNNKVHMTIDLIRYIASPHNMIVIVRSLSEKMGTKRTKAPIFFW